MKKWDTSTRLEVHYDDHEIIAVINILWLKNTLEIEILCTGKRFNIYDALRNVNSFRESTSDSPFYI